MGRPEMATIGLLASWAAALFGGWSLVAGLTATAPGHPVRRSAERALVASAVAALVASGAMLSLLLAGDVTITYVARSITTNLPTAYRVAALWNVPAGAVLPTAALVAIAGRIATHRSRSSLGTAAIGAIVMALCAASLAAAPFSTLPWIPTDGLGLSPELQHPLSVVGRVALSVVIAAAAAHVAQAAARLATERRGNVGALEPLLVVTIALLAVAMWSAARGSYATGVSPSPAPLLAWHGTLTPALLALVLAWQAASDGSTASFTTSLGALGLISAVLLGATVRATPGLAQSAFTAASLAAVLIGAMIAASRTPAMSERLLDMLGVLLLGAAAATLLWLTARDGVGMAPTAQWPIIAGGAALVAAKVDVDRRNGRLLHWIVLSAAVVGAGLAFALVPQEPSAIGWSALAAASAALAIGRVIGTAAVRVRLTGAAMSLAVALAAAGAAGQGWARESSTTVASGATVTAASPIGAPFVLAHQGISRFEDGNAHVEAVALEPTRNGHALPLLSTDRREYVDSRDELLARALTRPAVLDARFVELRVRVDDVGADERVQLRLTVVPFAAAWGLAVACLMLAAISQLIPAALARPDSAPVQPGIA